MKRARESDSSVVVIEYPKILFIVSSDEEEKARCVTLVFQPYLGDECNRLLNRLRNEGGDEEDTQIGRVFISLLFGMTREEDHKILSRVCLTDTKKNCIGLLEPIALRDVWQLGPIRVEYLKLSEAVQPHGFTSVASVNEGDEIVVQTPSSPRPPPFVFDGEHERELTPELIDIKEHDDLSRYPPYLEPSSDMNTTASYVSPLGPKITQTIQSHQMSDNKNTVTSSKPKKKSPSQIRYKENRQRARDMDTYRPSHNNLSPRIADDFKRRTFEILERHYGKREKEPHDIF